MGRRNWRRLAVALGWALVLAIIVLSLAPLPQAGPDIPHSDKWGHLLAYGVLMAWFAGLYPGAAEAWRFFAGFALLGISLELLQSLLPYRDGDVLDGAVDVIGLFMGLAAMWAWRRLAGAKTRGNRS